MKIKYLIFCSLSFLLSISNLKAQIGIGTDNPQQILHIDAKKDNSTSDENRYHNDVVITSNGKVGVGNINPVTKLDMRNASEENVIGIGTTTQTASAAGIGAVRYYNDGTNAGIEYSDGTNWIPVQSKSINALVYASKSSVQSINSGTSTTITNWTETTDDTNSFTHTTGVFTAPKSGVYVVSLNLATASGSIANNSRVEVIISSNTTTSVPEFRCLNSYPGYTTGNATNIASGNCTGIFYLNQGETITPKFWQNISTTSRNIIADASLNTLTIYGL